MVGAAIAASTLSSPAVVAAKIGSKFDATDALYGGVISVLYPVVFAAFRKIVLLPSKSYSSITKSF